MDDMKEWKKQMEERRKSYSQECRKSLQGSGLDVDKLTDVQAELIMQPSDAPENYHCDGEITSKQAFANWKFRLQRSGLSPIQIKLAIKFIFG